MDMTLTPDQRRFNVGPGRRVPRAKLPGGAGNHCRHRRLCLVMLGETGEKEAFDPRSLDAVNFLLGGRARRLRPLSSISSLSASSIGASRKSASPRRSAGCSELPSQTPIGAAIDATHAKRGVVVLALAAPGVAALVIFFWPSFWPVLVANSFMALAGDVFGPSVAGLTLGLFARRKLARRMGRNSAFDHAGNVAIALVAGAVGYLFSQRAVFLLAPFPALARSWPSSPFQPGRSIMTGRATRDAAPNQGTCRRDVPPAMRPVKIQAAGRSFASAPSCSISPMRRCCRSSARNSPRR